MNDPKPPVYDARLENLDASPVNPQRIGRFVKVVRVPRGRMNAGTWWQLTDGRGSFWDVRPDRLRLVPDPGQAPEGEQSDDEVVRLRSVLAARDRELKAALTQVHELRTAADTGQVGQTGADWAARPRRFSPEDTLSVAERLGAAEPSGDTGRPTVEPSAAWVIGRFTDATAQHGDRTFKMWDDDVHRTSAAALHHHVMHVEDPDPWSWHIYALVRIAYPKPSADTVQAPTAEIAGWDGAS